MPNDIIRTKAKVGLVFPEPSEIYNVLLAEDVEAGETLYLSAAGTYGLAEADVSGKQCTRGMALDDGGAGQAISMLKHGIVYGFTLTGCAYDDPLYQSDTPGEIADAPGTESVQVGRVVPLADPAKTKVLYFDPDWTNSPTGTVCCE